MRILLLDERHQNLIVLQTCRPDSLLPIGFLAGCEAYSVLLSVADPPNVCLPVQRAGSEYCVGLNLQVENMRRNVLKSLATRVLTATKGKTESRQKMSSANAKHDTAYEDFSRTHTPLEIQM